MMRARAASRLLAAAALAFSGSAWAQAADSATQQRPQVTPKKLDAAPKPRPKAAPKRKPKPAPKPRAQR
jgi:hypothetical protein